MDNNPKKAFKGLLFFCGTAGSAVAMNFFARKAKEYVGGTAISIARWVGEAVGDRMGGRQLDNTPPRSPYSTDYAPYRKDPFRNDPFN